VTVASRALGRDDDGLDVEDKAVVVVLTSVADEQAGVVHATLDSLERNQRFRLEALTRRVGGFLGSRDERVTRRGCRSSRHCAQGEPRSDDESRQTGEDSLVHESLLSPSDEGVWDVRPLERSRLYPITYIVF